MNADVSAALSIHGICLDAQKRLALSSGLDTSTARLEAQLLLQHVLDVNRAWLISHESDPLPVQAQQAFSALLARRLAGEPIAYILGKREFYGLDLSVTADTLIPRPDTETLVEAALEKIPDDKGISPKFRVLDLGTGTGAIALAIASQRLDAEIIAVDASAAALNVATHNAEKLNLKNIRFLQSDWFSALKNEKFDVIVSNPPYIAQSDPHLSQGDLRFEPLSALISGKDGMEDIKHIIAATPAHLNSHGWLMLEHGHGQSEKVAQLLCLDFGSVISVADLSGVLRVTLGAYIR